MRTGFSMGTVADGAMVGMGEGAVLTLTGGVGIGGVFVGTGFGTDPVGEDCLVTSRTGFRGGTVADGAIAVVGEGAAFALTGGVTLGGVVVGDCFGIDAPGEGSFPSSRMGFRGGIMVDTGEGV